MSRTLHRVAKPLVERFALGSLYCATESRVASAPIRDIETRAVSRAVYNDARPFVERFDSGSLNFATEPSVASAPVRNTDTRTVNRAVHRTTRPRRKVAITRGTGTGSTGGFIAQGAVS